MVSKRVVLVDVPRHQKPGTFGCSPVAKTGTRVHADVPQYQTTGTRAHLRQRRPFTKPPLCFLLKCCTKAVPEIYGDEI